MKPDYRIDAQDAMSGDIVLRFVDRRDYQLPHRHLDAHTMPRGENRHIPASNQ
ncbi:hypothetical protein [Burkholderia gladioli]|uniref:hypothetical protein n=1 Tax=Burkholderia gladioli TaxID=28095 RepID=UPI00163E1BD2|nr:hypothetical protein [Burkholderia gladioli]